MPVLPVEIGRFGALNLSDDAQEIQQSAAVDLLDVDLNRSGRLRARDGYTKWTTSAAASRLGRLWAFEGKDNNHHLFAARPAGNEVIAHVYDNTKVASGAIVNGSTYSYTLFGGTNERVYGPSGNVAGSILKWTGSTSTFSFPAVGYHGTFIGKQPIDNRLIIASELNSATVTQARVRFSNAGAPETFSANDYVDLLPNDGSQITGIAVYGNLPIVFKDDKFFVFYGNSLDGSGNAIFNYRMVDVGIGIPFYFFGACCVAPEGVYFMGSDGIYLTTGGTPVKVSKALDPLFRESALSPYYQGSSLARTTSWATAQMAWMQGRLYVTLPTGSSTANDTLFVLDPDVGWMVWSIPAAGLAAWLTNPGALTSFDDHSFRRMFFSYGTGTNDIGIITPGATTDAGAAITGRYRTGFITPAVFSSARTRRGYPWPGAEGIVREWLIDGQGTVTVKTSYNDNPTLGTGASVALGTSPVTSQGRDRRAVRGRNVSLEISGTAPWQVSRVIANVQSSRGPANEAEA